jgi:hypothetical protein
MLSQFLLPETVARQDGAGAEIAIEFKIVRLTLSITRIIAQESLEVSVWGSPDGERWRPLAAFPQKFYCGTYSMVIDLTRHPEVQYLHAEWKVARWTTDERAPLVEFCLRADDGLLHEVGKVTADVV